jgi:Pyruvate/2-oxoacid:ferredoxin oxidoreductase delta subunit
MSVPNASDPRVALYEGPGSVPLADEARFELLSGLLDAGYDVTRVLCKCGLSSPDSSALLVLGRFDQSLSPFADNAADTVWLHVRDISNPDVPGVVAMARQLTEETGAPAPGTWTPWFPVIDYSRCTNCKQCLSFCLFDVFGTDDDDRIQVQNPANCKTNCPACARVCPNVAIIFPKHAESPINGDVVRAEDLQREPVQVDLAALVGRGVQSTLRARSEAAKKRFSLERDPAAAEQLCACRRRQIQQELGIPDDVLASMCGASELREAAEHETRTLSGEEHRARAEEEWGI